MRHEDVLPLQPDNTRAQDVIWVDQPPLGSVADVNIAFMEPDQGWLDVSGMRPLAAFGLADQRCVLVLLHVHAQLPEHAAFIAEKQAEALALLTAEQIADLRSESGIRMGLFGYGDDGHRIVWDLASSTAWQTR